MKSSSLPNLVSTGKHPVAQKFLNLRRNYSHCVCDDEGDASEQPIDFSKKYSETDLDESADYSWKYPEDCNKKETSEFVQDTVKTYCTEDTPYETPFNFSTSTSMSDLRMDDKEKLNDESQRNKESSRRKSKSGFSSGLMSPEKPVSYCDEGTPGYFSRVASCGSLNLIAEPPKPKEKKAEKKVQTEKAVKFEEVVNYAEETPLMFSRSSSLASLDSIEQHSIHDDRSSVVSDFSRLTSGVISPSELPDSPSQTVPPSPRPEKKSEETSNPPVETFKFPALPKSEDCVRTYCTEDTPAGLSHAGSNSDLSLLSMPCTESCGGDVVDGEGVVPDLSDKGRGENLENNALDGDEPGENGLPNPEPIERVESNRSSLISLSDESEDALLQECILAGMPKSSDNEIPRESTETTEGDPNPYDEDDDNEDDEDLLASCISAGISNNKYSKQPPTVTDCLKTYCTEDTPALLSHAGSNSDLSVLSLQGQEEDYLSDDEEKLLEECIRAGMPNDLSSSSSSKTKPIDLNISLEGNISDVSSEDYEAEQALLRECIRAGMPKKTKPKPSRDSIELTEAEKTLLQQCILEGMRKCRISSKKPTDDSSELTESDQALLRQCILAGMPKKQSRDSGELTEAERALLEQCILAGMPKSRGATSKPSKVVSKQWSRRPKESERENVEHTCCIHCPRNQNRRSGQVRLRKRSRVHEKVQIQSRDGGEINIFYVTSQILAMKKEFVDRSHEEWI